MQSQEGRRESLEALNKRVTFYGGFYFSRLCSVSLSIVRANSADVLRVNLE